jgi:hypothetical protein
MAYRLHVRVGDGARMLGAAGIAKAVPGLLAGPERVGYVGTRHGIPGIWIERHTKAQIRLAAWKLTRFEIATGVVFVVDATNEATLNAVRDLIPFGRLHRG